MRLVHVLSLRASLKSLAAVLLAILSFAQTAQAQDRCGTVPYMNELKNRLHINQTNEAFEEWLLQKRQALKSKSFNEKLATTTYRIPVVVHVIHNGEAEGVGTNISDAQIISQINVLNNDFKRLNADQVNTPSEFSPVAGAMDIEFVLAKQSPQGLPTTGIVRTKGQRSSWTIGVTSDNDHNGIEDFKEQSYWPAEDYFNIWVIKMSNYLGYAQFPITNKLPGLDGESEDERLTDGVVIDYRVFGSDDDGPFDLDPDYNKGRSLTHEVGHFFGLRHIWGDDESSGNVCSVDDYVSDTPLQGTSYLGECPATQRTSCTSSDMYQNYMDYTDDECMNLFTAGQVGRMTAIIDDPDIPRRNSLLTSHGLEDPLCPGDPPVDLILVSIDEPGAVSCVSNPSLKVTVRNNSCPTITDLKINFSVGSSSFTKQFTGLSIPSDAETQLTLGTISLSSGLKELSVSVEQINGKTDDDNTNSDATFFLARTTASEIIPIRQNFDDNSFGTWTRINPQAGLTWDLAGSYNARFASPLGNEGEESWLVSPQLDFSFAAKASLFFDLDYSWSHEKNDRLRVMVSNDCGKTYSPTTVDMIGSVMKQNNDRLYLNMNSWVGMDSILVAFRATNAGGDNIDIDNIEFYESDSPEPLSIDELLAIYYDNSFRAIITFNLPVQSDVRLAVYNVMGQSIQNNLLERVLNQTYDIDLGRSGAGVYIFKFQIGTKLYAKKVLLTN